MGSQSLGGSPLLIRLERRDRHRSCGLMVQMLDPQPGESDVLLANPPCSIKQWNREAWQNDPWGLNFLGTPPQVRADDAFFQHILCSMIWLSGRCTVLFPHGVLFRKEEAELRRQLVEGFAAVATLEAIATNDFSFSIPLDVKCKAAGTAAGLASQPRCRRPGRPGKPQGRSSGGRWTTWWPCWTGAWARKPSPMW